MRSDPGDRGRRTPERELQEIELALDVAVPRMLQLQRLERDPGVGKTRRGGRRATPADETRDDAVRRQCAIATDRELPAEIAALEGLPRADVEWKGRKLGGVHAYDPVDQPWSVGERGAHPGIVERKPARAVGHVPGGVDGDELEVGIAPQPEEPIVRAHPIVLATTGERRAEHPLDGRSTRGDVSGGDDEVVEDAHRSQRRERGRAVIGS